MITATRHLAAVITWKPLAATAAAMATWLALSERPSSLLLAVAAAAVASAAPAVLDDTAAATLQSSPATLRRRRMHRVALILPVLATWWVLAALIVSRSTVDLPLASHTLQFAALVGIGLAGASVATRFDSDRSRGGITGGLVVIICFGTTFLPERALQLVPADPAAPGAGGQLIALTAIAVAAQLIASSDPAHRAPLRSRAETGTRT